MAAAREKLFALLRRFDDEAFVALANRGLLRRAQKDLEKQAAIVDESDAADAVTVTFAGQRIRFDGRGPAFAQCSCPASGVCQHILAAALALQKMAVAAETTHVPPPPQPSPASQGREPDAPAAALPAGLAAQVKEGDPATALPPPLAGEGWGGGPQSTPSLSAAETNLLHDALLALTATDLTRHAGKAGYRWAWQFITDLEGIDDAVRLSGDRHVVIEFRQPRLRFRYMGGGPESVLADGDVKSLEKYQVAAVLAYQRASGAPIAAPEPARKAKSAALDLGKDHALAGDTPGEQHASRERLRASTRRLIEENIELGLSHLSAAIHERFATLAVWAQGAEYYRLALLLRRLADHVELLLERAGSADEQRLLDELTLAYALVEALGAAEARGAAPARLLGRSRSTYADVGQLDLIGLGATPWRSAAGYVGLTMIFYAPKEKAFYSCSDARPEMQRGFNPRARYKAPGPWSGLGAPERATGRRVIVAKAMVNAQARLSGSEQSSATVQPLPDLAGALETCTSWAALAEQRLNASRSLLAEPQPMLDWAVLQPARFGAARFDTTRQVLVWPLVDAADNVLTAELAYSDFNEHAIKRIEQLAPGDLPDGTRLVARVNRVRGGLVAEPLSLVHARAEHAVDALHFDAAPAQNFVSKWLSRLGAGAEKTAVAPLVSSAVPPQLRELREFLVRCAERGAAAASPTADATGSLAARVEQCAAIGLAAFVPSPPPGVSVAAHTLATNYVRLQYERLLSEPESELD